MVNLAGHPDNQKFLETDAEVAAPRARRAACPVNLVTDVVNEFTAGADCKAMTALIDSDEGRRTRRDDATCAHDGLDNFPYDESPDRQQCWCDCWSQTCGGDKSAVLSKYDCSMGTSCSCMKSETKPASSSKTSSGSDDPMEAMGFLLVAGHTICEEVTGDKESMSADDLVDAALATPFISNLFDADAKKSVSVHFTGLFAPTHSLPPPRLRSAPLYRPHPHYQPNTAPAALFTHFLQCAMYLVTRTERFGCCRARVPACIFMCLR